MSDVLLGADQSGVRTLTFHRPEKKNSGPDNRRAVEAFLASRAARR